MENLLEGWEDYGEPVLDFSTLQQFLPKASKTLPPPPQLLRKSFDADLEEIFRDVRGPETVLRARDGLQVNMIGNTDQDHGFVSDLCGFSVWGLGFRVSGSGFRGIRV